MTLRTATAILGAGLLLAAEPVANAFNLPLPPAVVEFVNDVTGHYTLLVDPTEIHGVETGAAGPGWRRTGYAFSAAIAPSGVPVCRFYNFGAHSHFFTANAQECADLRANGSGWVYEKSEFNMSLPQAGSCGLDRPVWRFYNNRWMYNDSNHRYTGDPGVRAEMLSRGWIEEGIAFCTQNAFEVPAQTYQVVASQVRPSTECEDESINVGPCIALNQIPSPTTRIPWSQLPTDAALLQGEYSVFARITGVNSDVLTAQSPQDPAAVLSHSFIQAMYADSDVGIHVAAVDRTSGSLASINPLFQFFTHDPAPGEVDPRVFPWRDAGNNEVRVSFGLTVKGVLRDDTSSHAYGHPTLEFIDVASREHLYVTLQAYGTQTPGDFVARDSTTGRVIVSTVFRADPAFGHRYEGEYVKCSASAPYFGGCGSGGLSQSPYRFGIDRAAFQAILAKAHGANPLLSEDPGRYFLRNFHFNNEVYGSASLGMSLMNYRLEIFDR